MNITAPNISTDSQVDYLALYDQAKEEEKYPLVHKWLKTEPLPFFKQLRKERPVLVTPECVLVACFSDVRDLLQMPKVFTVDLYKPKMGVTEEDPGYLMAHDDDALHYREKSLMQGFLNRDDIPRVRQLVQREAKNIIAQASGKMEVVQEYCRWVPAILVEKYFGLNGIDKNKLLKWSFWNQYNCFHNQPFDLNSTEKFEHIVSEHNKTSEELVAYIAALMARKVFAIKVFGMLTLPWRLLRRLVGRPANDDMVTRMIRSSMAREVDFSLLRVGVNAGGLLIGAIETTSQAVAQTIKFFIDQPQLLAGAKIAAREEDPKNFDNMVWEALRYVPISPYMFRQAGQDYTVAKGTGHETTIKKGTNVLLLTQSAMFDEYAYSDPDDFDPNRNWYHHFNFGFGSHECLGKYVGMVMIPEMVRQILLKDDLQANSEMDFEGGPFPEKYQIAWKPDGS
jgi:cytochrome P450